MELLRKIAGFGVVFAALAAFFAVVTLWCFGRFGAGDLYNTDLIQPFMIARDFVRDPGSLFDWSLSPANFIFPDTVVAVVLTVAHVPIRFMPEVYAGLLLAGMAMSAGLLLKTATGVGALTGAVIAAAALAVLIATASASHASFGGSLTTYLVNSYIHTGALVIGLLATALAMRAAFAGEMRWTSFSGLCAMVFLMAFSDLIFIFWFLIPITVVWGIIARQRRSVSMGAAAGVLFAMGLAGAVADHLWRPGAWLPGVGVARSLLVFEQVAVSAAVQRDGLLIAVGAFTVAMAVHGLILLARVFRGRQLDIRNALLLILVGVQLSSLVVPIASGRVTDPATLRYCFPALVVPYVWLGASFLRPVPMLRAISFGIAGALALVTIFAWPAAVSNAGTLARLSELARCVISLGRTDGMADYWAAKQTIFYSDYQISIAQLTPDGHPFRIGVNQKWLTNRIDGAPLRPTFIVMQNLDPASIRAKFGAPASVVACAGTDVWLYANPLTPPVS